MKYIFCLLFLIGSISTIAEKDQMHVTHGHSHEGHLHDTMIDGKLLEVNPDRFDNFVSGLTESQVAIISVNGMVCDFCARGIEKTFKKDKFIIKIDVDLAGGKVLIAYSNNKKIDFEDIQKKILSNGQNATALQVIDL